MNGIFCCWSPILSFLSVLGKLSCMHWFLFIFISVYCFIIFFGQLWRSWAQFSIILRFIMVKFYYESLFLFSLGLEPCFFNKTEFADRIFWEKLFNNTSTDGSSHYLLIFTHMETKGFSALASGSFFIWFYTFWLTWECFLFTDLDLHLCGNQLVSYWLPSLLCLCFHIFQFLVY